MPNQQFIQIGALGQVGRFRATDAVSYPRNARVICRTARGLEVGRVLSPADDEAAEDVDGTVLRGVTAEDDLLIDRLERNKHDAFYACNKQLSELGLAPVLVDTELTFDGQSLYFYFLGEVSPEVESITSKLAEAYETKAQISKFADTLTEGCGPDCGTEEGGGCSDGGCSTCSIAKACHSK